MSTIRIVVKPTAGGNKIEKEIETSFTIREVKELLAEPSSIPADDQRLIYKGQILRDEKKVEEYGAWLLALAVPLPSALARWCDTNLTTLCSYQALATITCCIWCVESPLAVHRGELERFDVCAAWAGASCNDCTCLVFVHAAPQGRLHPHQLQLQQPPLEQQLAAVLEQQQAGCHIRSE